MARSNSANTRVLRLHAACQAIWLEERDRARWAQAPRRRNLPQAQYFIRHTVDAAGILFEQDDSNNTTGIWVTLGIGVAYSTGRPRPGI